MSVPSFLAKHAPTQTEVQEFDSELANTHQAMVWVASMRALPEDPALIAQRLGKALHYELKYRRRRNVVHEIRGTFNRYRTRAERHEIERLLETSR